MTTDSQTVIRHYERDDLGGKILSALTAAGVDIDRLTTDDLAPIDQFHMGGREATRQLIKLARLSPEAEVLDAGGGIGGPARTLATEVGCRVTVVDLSPVYCEVGEMLTVRTGLSEKVSFVEADATKIPLPGSGFDVVWTQHSSMNIADKEALYAEFHRVLRPGGRLVIHEAMAGPNSPVNFPVPWARTAEISFVRTPDATKAVIEGAGFAVTDWVDLTAAAIDAWRARLAPTDAPLPPLSFEILLGGDFDAMARNLLRNLEEGRVVVIQAVFDRI